MPEPLSPGRVMGGRRAAAAPPQGPAPPAGPAAGRRPGGPDRHRVRPAQRHPVVDAAAGDGLRVGGDVLAAAAAALAAAGRVEEGAARRAPAGRPREGHRLGQGGRRQPDVPGRFWGRLTGPNPTDRAKRGTKRHLLVDGNGTPPAVRITGANRHESTQAMGLLDDVPPLPPKGGGRGRPRRRPADLYGDRAYGTPRNRRGLRDRRIKDHLAAPACPTAAGWARSGTWWNAPSRGSARPAASRSGMTCCRRSIGRSTSCNWPGSAARSSSGIFETVSNSVRARDVRTIR